MAKWVTAEGRTPAFTRAALMVSMLEAALKLSGCRTVRDLPCEAERDNVEDEEAWAGDEDAVGAGDEDAMGPGDGGGKEPAA